MSSTRVAIVALAVILGASAGFLANYLISTSQIEKLQSELLITQSNLQGLQGDFTRLSSESQSVVTQLQSLQTDYNSLVTVKKGLEDYIVLLESDKLTLQSRNNELSDLIEMDKSLRIDNDLTSYYDSLRYEYGLAGDESGPQVQMSFAAKLVQHDLGISIWPVRDDEYYSTIGSSSTSTASGIIDAAVERVGVNPGDDPTVKIAKVLRFITSRLNYSYDLDDVYRSPVETMSIGSGDCDDYSILACALLERVGVDSAYSIYQNDEGQYHAMTLVHLDDLGSYPHFTYSNLRELGLSSGNWIIIEPQRAIDYQGDRTWFEEWTIKYAIEIVE